MKLKFKWIVVSALSSFGMTITLLCLLIPDIIRDEFQNVPLICLGIMACILGGTQLELYRVVLERFFEKGHAKHKKRFDHLKRFRVYTESNNNVNTIAFIKGKIEFVAPLMFKNHIEYEEATELNCEQYEEVMETFLSQMEGMALGSVKIRVEQYYRHTVTNEKA